MLQPKDTDWLIGYKNKTHIYTVYNKPTSHLKTHIYAVYNKPTSDLKTHVD